MTEPLARRFERYRPLIVDEMRAVVGEDSTRLSAWLRYHLGWEDADGKALGDSSGKLLRPSALLLAAELMGGAIEEAVPAAAAVELVHNFSLLHDDVEDASERRHGRPAVWTFAGVPQAINAGDGMYTLARLAMHRLLEAGVEERRTLESMRELDEACLRLVEGQYLDISFEDRNDVTRAEYLAMTAGKTAAMFSAPFAMGALLGGASGDLVTAFREFGYHVGLAFQAMDDILGIWGEPEVTGKPVGDDLRSRKMTYPVIAAMASSAVGAALVEAYADSASTVEALRTLVEEGDGRTHTEHFMMSAVESALEALHAAALAPEAEAVCADFAHLATARVR
ncbi:MAG TPA: polyprenyl synthetase family protein [Dehalococcoidia bacterium]|nr:polyprenyl synthetase family protein [Dehalococcoidia bacterium]